MTGAIAVGRAAIVVIARIVSRERRCDVLEGGYEIGPRSSRAWAGRE